MDQLIDSPLHGLFIHVIPGPNGLNGMTLRVLGHFDPRMAPSVLRMMADLAEEQLTELGLDVYTDAVHVATPEEIHERLHAGEHDEDPG